MSTIPRRKILRTDDNEATRLLRFNDGLVVDPNDCPFNIHARSHWVERGVCHCTRNPAAAEPDQQPREHDVPCRACRRPTWNVTGFCDRCSDEIEHLHRRRPA